MTRRQLAAMLGVFCPAFVVLHVCCPRGNIFVTLGLSGFFAFMIVKSIVYTIEVRKAKKTGVDVVGLDIGGREEDDDIIVNPAFADLDCNVWHGDPVCDETAPDWTDDNKIGG